MKNISVDQIKQLCSGMQQSLYFNYIPPQCVLCSILYGCCPDITIPCPYLIKYYVGGLGETYVYKD